MKPRLTRKEHTIIGNTLKGFDALATKLVVAVGRAYPKKSPVYKEMKKFYYSLTAFRSVLDDAFYEDMEHVGQQGDVHIYYGPIRDAVNDARIHVPKEVQQAWIKLQEELEQLK